MVSPDLKSLLLIPYGKRDLKSHSVSPQVYKGNSGCEIHSYKLCRILAAEHHWDLNHSTGSVAGLIPGSRLPFLYWIPPR